MALNALKLDITAIENKYLAVDKKQLTQLSFAFLKYINNQFRTLKKNNEEVALYPYQLAPIFFGEQEVILNKKDKKHSALLKANGIFYFLNAAKSYDDVKIRFTNEPGEEVSEVRQIQIKALNPEKVLDFPKVSNKLFSFEPAKEQKEYKNYDDTYLLLGQIKNLDVLLDQKYGHIYLLQDKYNTEYRYDLIFVNLSAQAFAKTLNKINSFATQINQNNDLLGLADKIQTLKKNIWLIDKQIATRAEFSLWRDIFFPELDELRGKLIEKYLNDSKERLKNATHFSSSLSGRLISL